MKYAQSLEPGKIYKVYRNLRNNCWSVRNTKNRVVAHMYVNFVLEDVKFVIQRAGQRRVRETKQKAVHAYVQGKFVGYGLHLSKEESTSYITYNPYTDDYFKHVDTEEIIETADKAVFQTNQRMYVCSLL